jgi:hypothetical protein
VKPIRFTLHSLEKLRIIQQQGFKVDEEIVKEVVQSPQAVLLGYAGRLIAQAVIDQDHLLRVVYEDAQEISVVTLYPVMRRRYES